LLISLYKPKLLAGSIWLVTVAIILFLVASSWSLYNESLGILQTRFADSGIEEGIFHRFLKTFTGMFELASNTPFFGYGLGLGTNGAAELLGLRGVFTLGEDEFVRVIRESGALLGGAYLLMRVVVAYQIGIAAFRALKQDAILPLLLFSTCALLLFQGQFGQATILGLTIFSAGLCLAAGDAEIEAPTPQSEIQSRTDKASLRGRSAYAEALHGH
jgi:hypothetical protein